MNPRQNIVLIDPDAAIRAALSFSLGLEGFAVAAFASAEAWLARERLPGNACLVLDQHLPGMQGLDLLAALRQLGIVAPAVIITSNPSRRLRAEAAQAGAALVEKPLMGDALTAAIRHELATERLAA